jgi:hypothetical protein
MANNLRAGFLLISDSKISSLQNIPYGRLYDFYRKVSCSPERNSVGIIRIRLQKVIKCLAFNEFSQKNTNNTHRVSFGRTW